MSRQVSSIGRAGWASRLGFVLAAAGSAIGLGNIWKFPYIAGENGGGAFVLVYLACIVLLGLPIMVAELLVGRSGQRDAVGSFVALEGRSSPWWLVGWVSVMASFMLLAFYSVVAGWSFDYVFKAFAGTLQQESPDQVRGLFTQLTGSPWRVFFWQGVFIAVTVSIVIRGIRGGIERWSKILMPVLFVLLLVLLVVAMLSPSGPQALRFLLVPDFSRFSSESLLAALGHAFFTLSLGAGVMITYGSYLDPEADLFGLSFRIALLDTLVALVASLVIFSVVFSTGTRLDAGPGLVFQTLPILFMRLPFGTLLAQVFFLLLAFAALTSAISMLEVVVAYVIDEWRWRRGSATALVGGVAFLVGIPCALSFNLWQDVNLFPGLTVFQSFDLVVSSYMLPLGGLMVALYAGWAWAEGRQKQALVAARRRERLFRVWHLLVRYVAPTAVLLVLLNEVGLFD